MDLGKLRTFRMVAVMLHFNKAAEALHLAQSTVSNQIRALEEDLGELLFTRVHKKIALTGAGERLLLYANKMLAMEEEARARVSGRHHPAGTIRLLVPEALSANVMHRMIKIFLAEFPTVHFDVSNCSLGGLENELRTESVDLAFVFLNAVDSMNLHSEVIARVHFAVVAGARSTLCGKDVVDASDLNGQTLLLPKAGCGHGLLLRQMLNLFMATPASTIECTSIEAIRRFVADSDCVAVLPRQSVEDHIAGGQVIELPWAGSIDIDVAMVWHRNRTLSPMLERFMEIVRDGDGMR